MDEFGEELTNLDWSDTLDERNRGLLSEFVSKNRKTSR